MKLSKIFRVDEDVIDRTKQHGKALENMGINKSEIETPEDFVRAFTHFASAVAFATSALKSISKKFGDGQALAWDDTTAMLKSLSAARREVNRRLAPKGEPGKPEDPRTGYADDPNPETRGTQHPYRGYRSGD